MYLTSKLWPFVTEEGAPRIVSLSCVLIRDVLVAPLLGGAISNLYAVAVARFKAEPRSKQQGMTSLSSRLVMFTSEHVST